jgi:hypothetical protein
MVRLWVAWVLFASTTRAVKVLVVASGATVPEMRPAGLSERPPGSAPPERSNV